MSVLQNSKEEALNNAFKGDDNTGENNIVQELTKEIISEVQRMTGNDVCCDCGAPGDTLPPSSPVLPLPALGQSHLIPSHRLQSLIFPFTAGPALPGSTQLRPGLCADRVGEGGKMPASGPRTEQQEDGPIGLKRFKAF